MGSKMVWSLFIGDDQNNKYIYLMNKEIYY